jgi:methionyl-tRNA formyltransferase
MNIIFFTQEDPFYVKIFFDEFFKSFKPLNEIKAIVISQPMGKKSVFKLAHQMYNFYGLSNFLRMGVKYAFINFMGRKNIKRSEDGRIPKTYTVKQLALAYDLNVIERSDLNSKDFIQFIRQYDADLFISVACPIIFRRELITIPRIDCINIHNAPLPKYRGMLPNFWQLYHGEREAGITVHRIDAGIDTGDIIIQQYVPIKSNESLHELIVKTKREGAKIIKGIIEDFRDGKVQYRKMEGEGSYFSFPTRESVNEFKKRGRLIL